MAVERVITNAGIEKILLLLGDELRGVFVSTTYLPDLLHTRVIYHQVVALVTTLE